MDFLKIFMKRKAGNREARDSGDLLNLLAQESKESWELYIS